MRVMDTLCLAARSAETKQKGGQLSPLLQRFTNHQVNFVIAQNGSTTNLRLEFRFSSSDAL